MWCESCVDGQDLSPGDSCEVCGSGRKIIGSRKCEYPMTEGDENQDILVTELIGDKK